MIISWFTQPSSGGFSSYYMYDTLTAEFSRTRLELGRQGGSNDTFVSFFRERFVGFTQQDCRAGDFEGQVSPWSLDHVADLCYEGKALPDTPFTDAKVFDTSNPAKFVHPGSPVTSSPNLPPGIEAKHLALLAGDALVTRKGYTLTAGPDGADALVKAIRKQVCRVLDIDEGHFDAIPDELLIDRLKKQADTLREAAADEYVKNMDKALAAAEALTDAIAERIENGFTPTTEFTAAFKAAQEALRNAQEASGDDVQEALQEIRAAQESLETAIGNVDTAQYEAVTRELEGFAQSLWEAQRHALDWEETTEAYDRLTEADTVEEYLSELQAVEV